MHSTQILLALSSAALLAGPARAEIFSTPILPPPGAVYATSGAAGCFTIADLCVTPGTLSDLVPVSSSFGPDGQTLDMSGRMTTVLTTVAGATVGPLTLTGTVDELVKGRSAADATGFWSTELVGLDFTGSVLGHTVSVGLDPAQVSGGETSITPAGGLNSQGEFQITSFFDIFIDLSLDTVPPLTATRGPLELTLMPEPGPAALLGVGLAGLAALRRERRRAAG
jgi:hypothetical protein